MGTRSRWILLAIVSLLAVGLSLQMYSFEPGYNPHFDEYYPRYNNYLIFKHSFHHLVEGRDLYQYYPKAHWDLYKYSPTFPLLMAPMAQLPDWAGLILWNALNLLVLFSALSFLRLGSSPFKHWLAVLLVLQEAIGSTQNAQSNCLVAGLLIWGYLFMEERRPLPAGLSVTSGIFVKLFGGLGGMYFLLFPQRWKAIAWASGWAVLLFLAPLLFISWEALLCQYENWWVILQSDHFADSGYSVMGILETWFGWYPPKLAVLGIGLAILLLPLWRLPAYPDSRFRVHVLASILLWVVLFNHKAELPSFPIAVAGAAIWYFSQPSTPWRTFFILFVWVFTCLAPTDLSPAWFKEEWYKPYVIKALPCLLVWIALQRDLWWQSYDCAE